MKYSKRHLFIIGISLFSFYLVFVNVLADGSEDRVIKTEQASDELNPSEPSLTSPTVATIKTRQPNVRPKSVDIELVPGNQTTPVFKQFSKLQHQAIADADDEAKMVAMLNDENLLASAKSYLRQVPEAEFNHVAERSRLDSITYLKALMEHPNLSSLTTEAIDMASEVLLSKQYQQFDDKFLRKSLVGDKVELGLVLYQHYPEPWQRLKASTNSPKIMKILQYIEDQAKAE